MTKQHGKVQMKKAFTIIEIVIVIAIIGAMMAIFGNKLFGFFEKADMQTTLNTDADMIFTAATNYKNSSPLADNTYKGITAEQLSKYVSDKMKLDGTKLVSLGLNEGCNYILGASKDDNNSYYLSVNCNKAESDSSWGPNSIGRMQDIFMKSFKDRTAGTLRILQECETSVPSPTVGQTIGDTDLSTSDSRICLIGLK